jgi:toxin ParE1/3/4
VAEVRLTAAARDDLIGIWDTTQATWGDAQADAYLDQIAATLDRLAGNPRLGPDCSDLLPGLRRLVTGRHVAFYRIMDDHVRVIRVLHGSMDALRHLGRGD